MFINFVSCKADRSLLSQGSFSNMRIRGFPKKAYEFLDPYDDTLRTPRKSKHATDKVKPLPKTPRKYWSRAVTKVAKAIGKSKKSDVDHRSKNDSPSSQKKLLKASPKQRSISDLKSAGLSKHHTPSAMSNTSQEVPIKLGHDDEVCQHNIISPASANINVGLCETCCLGRPPTNASANRRRCELCSWVDCEAQGDEGGQVGCF